MKHVFKVIIISLCGLNHQAPHINGVFQHVININIASEVIPTMFTVSHADPLPIVESTTRDNIQ